jgi:hypothetical protein
MAVVVQRSPGLLQGPCSLKGHPGLCEYCVDERYRTVLQTVCTDCSPIKSYPSASKASTESLRRALAESTALNSSLPAYVSKT